MKEIKKETLDEKNPSSFDDIIVRLISDNPETETKPVEELKKEYIEKLRGQLGTHKNPLIMEYKSYDSNMNNPVTKEYINKLEDIAEKYFKYRD